MPLTLKDKDKLLCEKFIKKIDLYDKNSFNFLAKDHIDDYNNYIYTINDRLGINIITKIYETLENIINYFDNYKAMITKQTMFTKTHNQNIILDYKKLESNLDTQIQLLLGYKTELIKYISGYDTIYNYLISYFKKTNIYIIAGQEKIKHYETTVSNLKDKALEQKLLELSFNAEQLMKEIDILKLFKAKVSGLSSEVLLLQNINVVITERLQYSVINIYNDFKKSVIKCFNTGFDYNNLLNIINEYYTMFLEIIELCKKSLLIFN